MRKLAVMSLLLLLALGAFAAAAQAAPLDDLTALARYYPDTTLFFAALRTDAGHFETLDGVIGQLSALLPQAAIPPGSIEAQLNQAMMGMSGSSFSDGVRPWLGDTVAFGFTEFSMTGDGPQGLFAAAVTDRTKAESFLETAFERQIAAGAMERVDGDMTLFRSAGAVGDNPFIAVTDEALFYTSGFEPGVPDNPLSDSADFTATLAGLPADDYHLAAYVNAPAIAAMMNGMMQAGAAGSGMTAMMFPGFTDAAGPTAFGLTVLDGRSLVMDTVQRLGDTAAMEAAGLTMTMPTTPFDPAFAAHIPADAPLVMMGTELNTSITSGFDNVRALGRLVRQQMQALPEEQLDADARWLREVNAGALLVRFINLTFTGLTGLNLEQDVLPWMGGNYALYLRLLPLAEETGLPLTLDMGAVIEATDPAGPAALVESIAATFEDYEVNFIERQETGGPAVVFSGLIPATFPTSMQEPMRAIREFDLMVGSTGTTFVAGTRPAATFSLDPQGDTLADAPAFTEALGYALDGAQQFAFLNTRAFVPLIEQMRGRIPPRQSRDLEDLRTLAGLLSSGSISMVAGAESGVVARLVLTLAQEPLEPAPAAESAPTLIPTVLPTPTYVPTPTPGS